MQYEGTELRGSCMPHKYSTIWATSSDTDTQTHAHKQLFLDKSYYVALAGLKPTVWICRNPALSDSASRVLGLQDWTTASTLKIDNFSWGGLDFVCKLLIFILPKTKKKKKKRQGIGRTEEKQEFFPLGTC